VPGICDLEGAILEQRADGHPGGDPAPLDLYDEQTKPLERFYDERGLLRRVDGEAAIDDVTRALVAAIAPGAGD
jgi:adenylate kinase